MVESKYEEAKDQVNTRADAVKEHMKNPEWKDNKASNVIGDLTNSKSEVKADKAQESWKNTGINAYESVKDSVANAAQSASDWLSGDSSKK